MDPRVVAVQNQRLEALEVVVLLVDQPPFVQAVVHLAVPHRR